MVPARCGPSLWKRGTLFLRSYKSKCPSARASDERNNLCARRSPKAVSCRRIFLAQIAGTVESCASHLLIDSVALATPYSVNVGNWRRRRDNRKMVVYGDATLVIRKLGCQTRKVISSGHSALREGRAKGNGTQKWMAKQFILLDLRRRNFLRKQLNSYAK